MLDASLIGLIHRRPINLVGCRLHDLHVVIILVSFSSKYFGSNMIFHRLSKRITVLPFSQLLFFLLHPPLLQGPVGFNITYSNSAFKNIFCLLLARVYQRFIFNRFLLKWCHIDFFGNCHSFLGILNCLIQYR